MKIDMEDFSDPSSRDDHIRNAPTYFAPFSQKSRLEADSLTSIVQLPGNIQLSDITWNLENDGTTFVFQFPWPILKLETVNKIIEEEKLPELHSKRTALLDLIVEDPIQYFGTERIELPFQVDQDHEHVKFLITKQDGFSFLSITFKKKIEEKFSLKDTKVIG